MHTIGVHQDAQFLKLRLAAAVCLTCMPWLVDVICALHLPASNAAIVKGRLLPVASMQGEDPCGWSVIQAWQLPIWAPTSKNSPERKAECSFLSFLQFCGRVAASRDQCNARALSQARLQSGGNPAQRARGNWGNDRWNRDRLVCPAIASVLVRYLHEGRAASVTWWTSHDIVRDQQ